MSGKEMEKVIAEPHILILGAGPAGLGAAFQLTQKGLARVTVLEQCDTVGGNASSFECSGVRVDYGSHRFHPACDPEILQDIRKLLGDDLLDRPRHGRIRLSGKWIHFPLKPLDLAFKLSPNFTKGVVTELIGKILGRKSSSVDSESFASLLEKGLGRTICREFYFPYATKIWGLTPEELSPIQARRRVSASSLKKIIFKILSSVPGFKPSGSGRFFYPRQGFGQISERLYQASKNLGAEFFFGAQVKSLRMKGNTVREVCSERDGHMIQHQADYVWSTIPISDLVEYLRPSPPPSVIQASKHIESRPMILIYLVIEQERFSEYDAHYFPEASIPITRLSEPKNYSNVREPKNRTVLCAELPCSEADSEWRMTDEELGKIVCNCLELAAIPVGAPIKEVITRRLRQAYPIYRQGYEVYFEQIDKWFGQVENLLTFGRQGLFVHDNTHHALYMAYAAVKCLNGNGDFDRTRWQTYRRVFDTHVVED